MKVQSIEIIDTYGTEHATFPVGSVTFIQGANGTGKTSILDAVSYLFGGGTDPGVIRSWRCRNGAHDERGEWEENPGCIECRGTGRIEAEKSVVMLTLEDGTVFRKTTAPKFRRDGSPTGEYTSKLEVLQPDGTPRGAPQTYIEQFADAISLDPSTLLKIDTTTAAGRKALATRLMELMPLSFSPAEIREAFYERPRGLPRDPKAVIPVEVVDKPFDLDGLKKLSTAVTEERRKIGVQKEEAGATVNRLRQSLPAGDGANHKAALDKVKHRQAMIAAAEQERRDEITAEKAAAIAAANERWGTQLEELEAEAGPEREKAAADLATIEAQIEAESRAATLRKEIELQVEVGYKRAIYYDRLTEALENLNRLRLQKLKDIPVVGLEVAGDQVTLDGVRWDLVNTARRVQAVLQICALRSGKLPFLLIDNSEHLDKETEQAVIDGLLDAGFQLMVAAVTDEPLTITSVAERIEHGRRNSSTSTI